MIRDDIRPGQIDPPVLQTEIAYLERRASDEIQIAQREERLAVARPHYELAVRYLERADELHRVRRSQIRPRGGSLGPRAADRLVHVCDALASNLVGAVCVVDDDGGVTCMARDRWGNVQRVTVPRDADAASVNHHARTLRERVSANTRLRAR